MLRMVKRLIALSLGVHRLQLEQRMGLTWPRPFLLRPLEEGKKETQSVRNAWTTPSRRWRGRGRTDLFFLFLGILAVGDELLSLEGVGEFQDSKEWWLRQP
jgi:hypothetical protein